MMSKRAAQRVVIGMMDGLGMESFQAQPLSTMQRFASEGFFKQVQALMPSVTNTNNVSICCGEYPELHGITGNSYFNEETGTDEYMEHAGFLLVPTIFQRAAQQGIASALLTSKKKTLALLSAGTTIAVAAESPGEAFIQRYGQAPDIYSREINYWLWNVAIDLLKTRPDIGLLYVHTTDFPMHEWAPHEKKAQEHLITLDKLLAQAVEAAPEAAFLLTADHGMNYKRRCWDLAKACSSRGVRIRFALSAEKDRYVRHHRTFGGMAWIWLQSGSDAELVKETILSLDGVEEVLTRDEVAERFHLMPERIGELVVLGDKETVFGEMETEQELLASRYRSHGSLHELAVPLIIYNQAETLPPAAWFTNNLHLTRWLYR